jgi:hypothetical protein
MLSTFLPSQKSLSGANVISLLVYSTGQQCSKKSEVSPESKDGLSQNILTTIRPSCLLQLFSGVAYKNEREISA